MDEHNLSNVADQWRRCSKCRWSNELIMLKLSSRATITLSSRMLIESLTILQARETFLPQSLSHSVCRPCLCIIYQRFIILCYGNCIMYQMTEWMFSIPATEQCLYLHFVRDSSGRSFRSCRLVNEWIVCRSHEPDINEAKYVSKCMSIWPWIISWNTTDIKATKWVYDWSKEEEEEA